MTSAEVEEIKRHFSVVAEGVEKKVELVNEAVAALDAKVDRWISSFEERMARGFEVTLSSLEARIQKLEAS